MKYIFQASLSTDNGLVYIYTYALSAADRACELQIGILSVDNKVQYIFQVLLSTDNRRVHIYTYTLSMDNSSFYVYTYVLSMVDKLCDI